MDSHTFASAATRLAWLTLGLLAACGGGGNELPQTRPSYDLVFATQRPDGSQRLYHAAADGSGSPAELAGGTDASAPAPRPDGQRLVYTARTGDLRGPSQLMLLDLPSGRPSMLSARPDAVEREPAFAPDGRRIAFVSGRDEPDGYDVFVATLDGTRLADIVNLTPRATAGAGVDVTPAWSPDGRQIAFSSTRGNGSWALWLMNVDGSGARQLTTVPASGTFVADHHPSWSPDGKRIVFQRNTNGLKRIGMLLLPDATGGGGLAFYDFDGQAGEPAWSPDGRWIAFSGDLDGELDIFVRPVDGSGPVVRIRHPGPDFGPAWLLRSRH